MPWTDTRLDGTPVTSLTCVETARLLRAALKAAFPGQTFSARSSIATGGTSVGVTWTDGPTVAEVEMIAKPFTIRTPTGDYAPLTLLDGRLTRFGADLVLCERYASADLLRACAAKVAARFSVPAPAVYQSSNEHPWVADDAVVRDGYRLSDLVYQLAYATSTYTRPSTRP